MHPFKIREIREKKISTFCTTMGREVLSKQGKRRMKMILAAKVPYDDDLKQKESQGNREKEYI